MATRADLNWWWELAPTLKWTWAKSYADSAPHWWILLGRTPGLDAADFRRIGEVIRTFGEPGKFYSYTNLYLYTRDRRLWFWCMWGSPPGDQPDLVNVATTDRKYGPQRGFDEKRIAELRLPEEVTDGQGS